MLPNLRSRHTCTQAPQKVQSTRASVCRDTSITGSSQAKAEKEEAQTHAHARSFIIRGIRNPACSAPIAFARVPTPKQIQAAEAAERCSAAERTTIRALLVIGAARVAAMRLASRDVQGVAAYLASDACQKVVVLTGAGVSCAAGIPDFRSPGGMYDTLRPELITATPQERAAMARDPTLSLIHI